MDLEYRSIAQASQPAEEPVTLDEAKTHLRVTIPDDDALIGIYIAAARRWCEKETRRALVTRSYSLYFDQLCPTRPAWLGLALGRTPELPSWPAWGLIKLPRPPLVAVDSISYLDLGGVRRTLDPATYTVLVGVRGLGALSPAYGLSWPLTRPQVGSVVISYRAGYGTRQDVPEDLKAAILLYVGLLYRFREPVADVQTFAIPFTLKALLSTYRASIG